MLTPLHIAAGNLYSGVTGEFPELKECDIDNARCNYQMLFTKEEPWIKYVRLVMSNAGLRNILRKEAPGYVPSELGIATFNMKSFPDVLYKVFQEDDGVKKKIRVGIKPISNEQGHIESPFNISDDVYSDNAAVLAAYEEAMKKPPGRLCLSNGVDLSCVVYTDSEEPTNGFWLVSTKRQGPYSSPYPGLLDEEELEGPPPTPPDAGAMTARPAVKMGDDNDMFAPMAKKKKKSPFLGSPMRSGGREIVLAFVAPNDYFRKLNVSYDLATLLSSYRYRWVEGVHIED